MTSRMASLCSSNVDMSPSAFTVEFFCMAQHKYKKLKLNTHNDLDNL